MFEEKLTEENAQILLDLYEVILKGIKTYGDDLMVVHFAFVRRRLPLEFRGRFITPRKFADIKAQFRKRPKEQQELVRAGCLYETAWQKVRSALRFLEQLPYSDFHMVIPEVEDFRRNLGKEEKTG